MTEDQFLRSLVDIASWHGWRPYHVNKSSREVLFGKGTRHERRAWVSNINKQGEGFPDLVLVRPPQVLFVELKSDRGSLELAQREWRDLIAACPQVEWYMWRPSDYDEAIRILARQGAS